MVQVASSEFLLYGLVLAADVCFEIKPAMGNYVCDQPHTMQLVYAVASRRRATNQPSFLATESEAHY